MFQLVLCRQRQFLCVGEAPAVQKLLRGISPGIAQRISKSNFSRDFVEEFFRVFFFFEEFIQKLPPSFFSRDSNQNIHKKFIHSSRNLFKHFSEDFLQKFFLRFFQRKKFLRRFLHRIPPGNSPKNSSGDLLLIFFREFLEKNLSEVSGGYLRIFPGKFLEEVLGPFI